MTSLAWVGSYLALASSSCSQAVNPDALCAADWTALMADFGEARARGGEVGRRVWSGAPSEPHFFLGRVPPTKIDYRQKLVPLEVAKWLPGGSVALSLALSG